MFLQEIFKQNSGVPNLLNLEWFEYLLYCKEKQSFYKLSVWV